MTAELERLVEECNIALRLMGWEILTLVNIETYEKIGLFSFQCSFNNVYALLYI